MYPVRHPFSIEDQIKAIKAAEQFLPQKRLADLVQSQLPPLIELENFKDGTLKAVQQFELTESITKFREQAETNSRLIEDVRKLTDFPRLQIEEITKHAKARELAFAEIQKHSFHSIIAATLNANENISQLLRAFQPAHELAERLRLYGPMKLDKAWVAKIADVAAISKSVQESVGHLDLGTFAKAFSFSEEHHRRLTESFTKIAVNYEALWQGLRSVPGSLPELNPVVLEAPPVEFYQATTLLKSLYRDRTSPRSEKAELVLDEAGDNLENKLAQVDPRLVAVYRGAKSALKTGSPDCIRHFAVSMRELITHILHKLSPDEDFDLWNADNTLVYNGKPTRKGRLLYICRFVKHGPFTAFVDADVEATVEFIKLFQEGTHALEIPFTERQLKAMLRKAEGLLSYLLDIGLETRELN